MHCCKSEKMSNHSSLPRPQTLIVNSDAADTDTTPRWGEVRFNEHTELVLTSSGYTEKLVLRINHSLVLGRRGEGDAVNVPDVDLNVFDAYLRGVSKRHAMIEAADRLLTIHDLGSRNGTFINMQSVAAHSHRVIRDGDTIQLGNLELHVRFRSVAKV